MKADKDSANITNLNFYWAYLEFYVLFTNVFNL